MWKLMKIFLVVFFVIVHGHTGSQSPWQVRNGCAVVFLGIPVGGIFLLDGVAIRRRLWPKLCCIWQQCTAAAV